MSKRSYRFLVPLILVFIAMSSGLLKEIVYPENGDFGIGEVILVIGEIIVLVLVVAYIRCIQRGNWKDVWDRLIRAFDEFG